MTEHAFPADALIALAEHFENLGRAWDEKSVTGKKLREECDSRAAACRDAVAAYNELVVATYGAPNGLTD